MSDQEYQERIQRAEGRLGVAKVCKEDAEQKFVAAIKEVEAARQELAHWEFWLAHERICTGPHHGTVVDKVCDTGKPRA